MVKSTCKKFKNYSLQYKIINFDYPNKCSTALNFRMVQNPSHLCSTQLTVNKMNGTSSHEAPNNWNMVKRQPKYGPKLYFLLGSVHHVTHTWTLDPDVHSLALLFWDNTDIWPNCPCKGWFIIMYRLQWLVVNIFGTLFLSCVGPQRTLTHAHAHTQFWLDFTPLLVMSLFLRKNLISILFVIS